MRPPHDSLGPQGEGDDLLSWALAYAKRGWPVLPLHTVVSGGCSCRDVDCNSVGKHPRTAHGKDDATTNQDQIRQWWERWPDANIGLRCEPFLVLDVDPRNGGDESLDALFSTEADRDGFDTLEACTGGGGRHFYFQPLPKPIKRKSIADGLDIKSASGYVVAPPSLHQSSLRYRWVDLETELSPAPEWLIRIIEQVTTEAEGISIPSEIPSGRRNGTLYKLACSLRTNKQLCPEDILAAVLSKNSNACKPPLDQKEVEQLVASACTHPSGLSPEYASAGRGYVTEPSGAADGPPPYNWPTDAQEAPVKDDAPLEHVGWPSPLSEQAYHGVLGDLLREIEPNTEADIAAVLFQAIAMIGNVLGRSAYFTVEATNHYCNEFVCLVGATAKGRKGSSFKQVRSVLHSVDGDWDSNRIKSGLSSGEGLIYNCRDAMKEMVRGRGTASLQVTDPGEKDKRLLVVEEELAGAIKAMARDGNTLSAIVRQSWDSPSVLAPMTKNNKIKATDPHISVIGHITRDELLKSLKTVENTNGFANRFLWVCAKRSRELPFGGNLNQDALKKISHVISSAVEWVRERPICILFDTDAAEIWRDAYSDLGEVPPGMLGAVLSRGEAHVRRIAMLYAVLDCSAAVRPEHLYAALEVWRYSRDSATWVFSAVSQDDEAAGVEAALRRAGTAGLTKTEIHAALNRKMRANQLDSLLRDLLHRGSVCQTSEKRGRQTVNVFTRR